MINLNELTVLVKQHLEQAKIQAQAEDIDLAHELIDGYEADLQEILSSELQGEELRAALEELDDELLLFLTPIEVFIEELDEYDQEPLPEAFQNLDVDD